MATATIPKVGDVDESGREILSMVKIGEPALYNVTVAEPGVVGGEMLMTVDYNYLLWSAPDYNADRLAEQNARAAELEARWTEYFRRIDLAISTADATMRPILQAQRDSYYQRYLSGAELDESALSGDYGYTPSGETLDSPDTRPDPGLDVDPTTSSGGGASVSGAPGGATAGCDGCGSPATAPAAAGTAVGSSVTRVDGERPVLVAGDVSATTTAAGTTAAGPDWLWIVLVIAGAYILTRKGR